jgi:hypothetical protein
MQIWIQLFSQCGSGFGSREPNQCGSVSWSVFKLTKFRIFTRKNIHKVGKRSKKSTYEGTKAFLKDRKPGLFLILAIFHAPGCNTAFLGSALHLECWMQISAAITC